MSLVKRAGLFLNKVMEGVRMNQIVFSEGYIKDGPRNEFPEYIAQIVYRSPKATAALSRIKEFVIGTGIRDDLKDLEINKEGDTFLKFHAQIASDFAYLERLSIEILLKGGNSIEGFKHIPVEWVRWGEPDRETQDVSFCVVNPLFLTYESRRHIRKMPLWEGEKTDIKAGIEAVGGEKEFRGHILFINHTSEQNRIYSRPAYFSAENYINTDYRAGLFYDRYTANNFFLGGILTAVGDPNQGIPDKDGKIYTTLGEMQNEALQEAFSGAENAGAIMMEWVTNPELKSSFQPFQAGNSHEVFEGINGITMEQVCIAFGVPKILLPLPTTGKLGDSQEIRNAITFLNQRTEWMRQTLEQVYRKILSGFGVIVPEGEPIIKRIKDWTDLPENIVSRLAKDQLSDYLQNNFEIEPSEIQENDQRFNDEINQMINSNGSNN